MGKRAKIRAKPQTNRMPKSMEDISKGFAVVLLQDYSCQLSCQISSNCCFCTSDSNDPEKAKIKLMEYLIDIVL